MSRAHFAILLAILQQVGFAIETTAIRVYGGTLSPAQMSLMRCLGGVIIALCWGISAGGIASLKTHQPKLQVLRGLTTTGYGLALMWGFSTIPLVDATAISYLTAIWIVALAPLIGEHWTKQRIAAVVLGFVGAILVIKPTFADVNAAYVLFALLAALNAINFLLSRYTQEHGDSAIAVLFYANGIAALCTVPIALMAPISTYVPPMLGVAIVIVGPVAMLLGIIALRYIEASTMAPINYVRLILIGIIAPLLLREPVSLLSALGGGIIVGACWLAVSKRGLQWRLKTFEIYRQP